MSYRNLIQTSAKIETAGLTETVQRILDAVRKDIKIPYEVTLECANSQQARRNMQLLYEVLYFYPIEKSRLSLSCRDNNIRVKFRNKMETRGRKGLKGGR